jgi:hypothetical protein
MIDEQIEFQATARRQPIKASLRMTSLCYHEIQKPDRNKACEHLFELSEYFQV